MFIETTKFEEEDVKVKSILIEAEEIVSGERQDDYGSPEDSFCAIANLWNGYLLEVMDTEGFKRLSGSDVAHMMILLKIARNINKYKRDNLTDIAGYARAIQLIEES